MMLQKGRPNAGEQLKIQKKLRPYFERTLSASLASRETGYNIKTICNYYNKWSNEIRENEEPDFIARARKERERLALCCDDLIFQEYQLLDDIKLQIKIYRDEEKSIPKFFVSTHQDIIKTISSLVEKKCSLTTLPYLDEVIEKKIKEQLYHDKTS